MVVVLVVEVLVKDTAIMDVVVVVEVMFIGVLADVENVVAGVIVTVFRFSLTVSNTVDVPSGVAVDLFMDELAGVMLAVLPDITIEVLTGVNGNAFAVIMTALEFSMSSTLEEFSRWAAFDCRPRALLD